MASYSSSRFLILLGSSDEDADGGVDDDAPGVFLLLNTGNLCTRLCGSAAGTIGSSTSTVGPSSPSRIKSMLIHLTASGEPVKTTNSGRRAVRWVEPGIFCGIFYRLGFG